MEAGSMAKKEKLACQRIDRAADHCLAALDAVGGGDLPGAERELAKACRELAAARKECRAGRDVLFDARKKIDLAWLLPRGVA
jgi:hypothetical protein